MRGPAFCREDSGAAPAPQTPAMADGGFDAVPPPVSGLGNFKGVMLCNRPVDEPSKLGGGGGDGQTPFKSMVSATVNDQLGLNPCGKVGHEGNVKKCGPSAALRRHVRWLKELQGQMRDEREAVEQDEVEAAEKKKKLSEAIAKHREAVRTMMEARDAGVADMTQASQAPAKKEKKSAVKSSKPMWAMTEREKDNFEEDEADDLINFAEGLDYDKYVCDLEFRQGVQAMADRAGRLQKMQDSFKDELVSQFNSKLDEDGSTSAGGSPRGINLEEGLDGQSILGDLRLGSEYSVGSRLSMGHERYGNNGVKDWDSSTNAGDNEPGISRELRDAADIVMESNSNLKQVHSKASIAKVIARNTIREEPEEHFDLIETMKRDGAIKAPVITTSEDIKEGRPHKEVAASNLPYIYRSPAV